MVDVAGLRGNLAGTVLTSGDGGYDEARRVFNAMIDRRPAVIAGCTTAADVETALRFGRANDLPIAVRGGGHSVAGMSTVDDGLVIDLRRMNGVLVDPDAETVTVGGGATWSDLDRACHPYGLATTGGRMSTTGVGGFTLGGGTGWLDRLFGLACDNLVSVDLVTADGTALTVSGSQHPDLFWALHGGGGNFGVATSLTLRLHPLPAFTVAMLFWPPEAGGEVGRAYRDFLAIAPDELSGGFIFITAPPEPFVPPALVGRLTCVALVTFAGDEASARDVMAPLLAMKPAGTMIAEMPYPDVQCMLDDPPEYRNYWSAEHLDDFPDDAIDAFCGQAATMIVPSPSQHVIFPQGGAIGRVGADQPLPWRQARWVVHPFGLWDDAADDERGRQWVRDVRAAVRPWANGTVYLNFIGAEGDDRVESGLNLDRLAEVKRRYDPDNVFRLNHNIRPT